MSSAVRTGYTLTGITDAVSGGTKYYNANGTSARTCNKVENTTFYLQWAENTATLTYNANGHGTAPAAVTMKYTAACTAAAAISGVTGYTCSGWNTKSDGSGTAYAAGAQVKAANVNPTATTLYAQWTENTATLTYNANGHGTAPAAVTMKYTAACTAAAAITGVTGYTCSGWNTKSDGSGTAYAAGAQVKAANVNPSATTLYAQWTANTYTVTLNPNGGAGGTESVTATYGSAMPTPITGPTRTGYTFRGYFDTGATSGGAGYYNDIGMSVRTWDKASAATLYARWKANTYAVTLNPNGGAGGTTGVTATYDAAMPTATMPTRFGCNFLGYFDAAEGGVMYYDADGRSVANWNKDAAATLYAHWQAYAVTFDATGGAWADGEDVKALLIDIDTENSRLTYNFPEADPVRAEHVFLGWYESWTNGARKVEAGDELLFDGDHLLYARWTSEALPAEESDAVLAYDVTGEGASLTGAAEGKALSKTDFAIPEFTSNDADAEGAPYVSVDEYAFAYQNYDKRQGQAQRLTSVTFPTFVTNVASHAFQDCRGLTNVTFTKARDYATGEVAPIVVRDWAFKNSAVETVVFPAGSQVILEEGAFGYAEKLREVCFLGDVEVAGTYPFIAAGRRNSTADGAPTPVNVRLSAKLAANPDFVLALTNGMSSVRLTLDQSVIGEIEPQTFAVTFPTVTLTFKVPADSPWQAVTPETLYGFYATTPDHVVVGAGTALHPATLSAPDADGIYTATFTLPAEAESGFFKFCIGE